MRETGKRAPCLVSKFGTSADAFKAWLGVCDMTVFPHQRIDYTLLNQFDVVFVPGASRSVNWEERWAMEFCGWIREWPSQRPWVLGVCFGHELVCRAFGARVAPNTSGPELGIQTVQSAIGPLTVLQSHRQQVTIPPHLVSVLPVWATTSDTTLAVQGVASKELRIFTTQFHPDYSTDYFGARHEGVESEGRLAEYRDVILKDSKRVARLFISISNL
jgi:GMP synthase-like glutamine amidotransferase